jgi:hypothetical protein
VCLPGQIRRSVPRFGGFEEIGNTARSPVEIAFETLGVPRLEAYAAFVHPRERGERANAGGVRGDRRREKAVWG